MREKREKREKGEEKALLNQPKGTGAGKLAAAKKAEKEAKEKETLDKAKAADIAKKKTKELAKVAKDAEVKKKKAQDAADAVNAKSQNVAPLNPAEELKKAQDIATAAKAKLSLATTQKEKADAVYAIKASAAKAKEAVINTANKRQQERARSG